MLLKALLALHLATTCCALAADPFILVGTVTNTTNPNRPTSAAALMTFDKDGTCILKISPPLYGSGTCTVIQYDEKTGHVEIVSKGALLNISWTGTVKAETAIGTYLVESPSMPAELTQSGSFQFTISPATEKPLQISDVLKWDTLKTGDEEFLVIREGDIVSVHHKDGKYAGRRLILGKDGNPALLAEDGDKTSVYRDIKTNVTVMTWVKDGDSGYFIQPKPEGNVYLDRFLQPTGWSSIEVNRQTVFVHNVNGDLELFDSTVKPLGIRSGKTTAGLVYWSKTTGDVTEFFDQTFKPLNWYSFPANGNTYYARSLGKNKFVFYDASMRELKQPSRDGFWATFAKGVAAGLAAYGNSMQQAAVYEAQRQQAYRTDQPTYEPYAASTSAQPRLGTTNAYDSRGNSYTTTSQQFGTITFSNTTGTNGYTANSTTQRLGTFDYINGTSSSGSFSGSRQRIGNFDYTNLTTPSGAWNGTSNQIGNITYHNFTGPNGQTLNGSSIKIGNFIYTNMQ